MDTATTTCTVDHVSETTTCITNTIQKEVNGFTYGEILISFLLILILTAVLFIYLKNLLLGIRIENPTRNKYNKDL